ncbi:MAG: peptidoglycan-binding protein [Solirubrobacterales bacterium]|nr:peptidoglycan-binding protein [Solirubrobacterales bacterium]
MDRSFGLGKLNSEERPETAAETDFNGHATVIGIVVLAALALVLTLIVFVGIRTEPASAAAGGLGLAAPESKPAADNTGSSAVKGARFGARTLREGMSGADVKVLKSIVRSKRLLVGSTISSDFDRPTTSAVRKFQRTADMAKNGVVNKSTAKAMVRSLKTSEASWYGPGLYGNGTACGKVTLRPTTIGLANKNLPCGTKVLIGYRGKYVIAPVIDRGPYIPGRTWDLTAAAADAIGLTSAGVGRVRHAVISRGK